MCCHFGENELIELIAKINRVDVVAFEIGEHDDEENHSEEKDRRKQDREQEKPSFSRHLEYVSRRGLKLKKVVFAVLMIRDS